MTKLKLFVALVLTALMIIIIVQNTEPVDTDILFLTITMSRAALLAFAGFLGFGLGILTSFFLSGKIIKKS